MERGLFYFFAACAFLVVIVALVYLLTHLA